MKAQHLFSVVLVILAVAAVLVFAACTYVIDEREQAVVTRISKPIRIIIGDGSSDDLEARKAAILESARGVTSDDVTIDPSGLAISQGAGLYFKAPFIDEVERFPDVVLEYDAEPREIVLADKKKLNVDNFGRWRIDDPLLYRIRIRTERNARDRLDDIIYSVMREELGKSNLTQVIRTSNRFVEQARAASDETEEVRDDSPNPMTEVIERGRQEIMSAVTRRSAEKATQYGIRIIDVRIKRADLLKENLDGVFGRMQAERSRISKGYRSEGRKEADIIMGNTNRRVNVILATAKRDAQILHGEGDAEALGIYAQAFNTNPQLYRLIRGLEVIKDATPSGSELVIGLSSSIYKLLETD